MSQPRPKSRSLPNDLRKRLLHPSTTPRSGDVFSKFAPSTNRRWTATALTKCSTPGLTRGSGGKSAQAKVKDFREWIAQHRDELTALQVRYSGTRPLKLSLKDLRQLKDALSIPPLAATPTQLWRAFQAVEGEKVRRARRHATDRPLVTLVQRTCSFPTSLYYRTCGGSADALRSMAPRSRDAEKELHT